jgi:hypothetical protein
MELSSFDEEVPTCLNMWVSGAIFRSILRLTLLNRVPDRPNTYFFYRYCSTPLHISMLRAGIESSIPVFDLFKTVRMVIVVQHGS